MAQLVSTKDEGRTLHTYVKRLIPKSEGPVRPTTIWAGVLGIDHGHHIDELDAEDFLWIKAKGSVTIQKIRDAYQDRQSGSLKKEDWVLNFIGTESIRVLHRDTTLAELDVYNDKCIIFEAAKAQESIPPTSRQPLQPTNPTAFQPKSPNRKLTAQPSIIYGKPNTIYEKPTAGPNLSKENTIPASALASSNNGFLQGPRVFPSLANYNPHEATGLRIQQGDDDLRSILQQGEFMTPQSGMSMHQVLEYSHPIPPSNASPPLYTLQSPPSVVTPGFKLYLSTFSAQAKRYFPLASSALDIEKELWNKWCRLPSEGRNYYEQQAEAGATPGNVSQPASANLFIPSAEAGTTANSDPQQSIEEDSPSKKSEPAGPTEEVEGEQQKSFQLQGLLKDAGPEMLEQSVEEGVKLLDDLKGPLIEKMTNDQDSEQWLQQIETLKKQAVKTKTVIGVVGNTGAGKSSVINAMLDEERLVPTNCMRACTAVVTEISYNYEPEPYRAQIEFISSADWEKELKTLFEDLFDGEGRISRDCTNEDTDAGIAYAKIKAVYPRKTKEDISHSSPENMLREVAHILGTTRDIKETDSVLFYKKLQSYIDSKEKSTSKKDKDKDGDKKKEPKQMEFWPLIRVVRINVKSPALNTGAVIVDLPGVHDANAARAAVAEGYMKQCTGLWIVAPINRAVDDKAAKSLLGESFKRQLKMDGGFSAVTFICSKTDDISLEEAQDSLGLDDQMSSSWEEMDRLVKKQRVLKKQVEQMQDSKVVFGNAQNDADEQIEVWEALKEDLEAGRTVFAPKSKSETKKRKCRHHDKSSKKKRRTDNSDAEEDDFTDDRSEQSADTDEDDSDGLDGESERPDPLTEDQITAKLQELKASKKEARIQRTEVMEKIKNIRQEVEEAKEAENKLNSQMSSLCISGRNQYSKGAIQQDFAAGIKEIDQELAAEEDEENFNPDVEIRDYDEVARSLPVFCVSSRGYQKLQGRLKKDPHVPGFTHINETEIPQLQAHCEKLTESGRSANCRSFMNKLSQLLNSLVLWASSDGTGANLTSEQRAREDKHLQKGLKNLETGLEKAIQSACCELDAELTENVYDKYETAVSNATEAALQTVLHWGLKVNRDNREEGGYYWSTYKAICRRNGVYSNAQGPHDWNTTLTDPIMKVVASGWEKAFSRRIPMVMANFTRDTAKHLKQFHKDIEGRARKTGTSIASLHMLHQQVGVYESNIKDIASATKDKIIAMQKDINREFTPVIEKAMEAAYNVCTEASGTGSFARMKAAMNSHIAAERHVMFQQSVDEVQGRLDAMIKDVKENLDDKVDEIFIQMRRDYRSVLGGANVTQEGQLLPKAQRLVRKELLHLIEGCERRFKRIAEVEVENDEELETKEEDKEIRKVKREGDDECQVKEDENADVQMADIEVKREPGITDGQEDRSNPTEHD